MGKPKGIEIMFEYKVVPAPTRGLKAKGVKSTSDRFANALETVMNDLGAQGWEYQRTDTLPVEERKGLTGKSKSFQNMLVFRRALAAKAATRPAAAQRQPVATGAQVARDGSTPNKRATEPKFTAPEKTATPPQQTKAAPQERPTPTLAAPVANPSAGNAASAPRETSSRARTSRTTDPVTMKR